MPTYIGENKIIDRYLGDKFLEAAYIGDKKVYDPYTEITGYLPMIFKSRAAVALRNYRIYGTSAGAGVETENLIIGRLPGVNIKSDGELVSYSSTRDYHCCIIPIEIGKNYGLLSNETNIILAYYETYPVIGGTAYDNQRHAISGATATLTAPITGYLVMRGSVSNEKETVILSSDPPETYIPPGYKLPLTVESGVTENILDINSTWYKQNPNDTVEISGNEVTITANLYDYIKVDVDANTDYTIKFNYQNIVGSMHRIVIASADLATIIERFDGTSGTFNTGNYTSIAVLFYAGGGSKGKTKYSNIMLTEGSTPPDHYIPHRYATDIPIYIGSSKLGEEEYVDFGEQKVYKRTENLFTEEGSGLIQITATGIKRYGKDVGVLSAGTYTIDYTLLSHASVSLWLHTVKDNVYTSEQIVSHPYTFTLNEDKDVIFRTSSQQPDATWQTLGVVDIMLVSGSTAPSTYIPYLQPTDPPVPFPPIPTYKGENTLSSTEALGEVTVKGRIGEAPIT